MRFIKNSILLFYLITPYITLSQTDFLDWEKVIIHDESEYNRAYNKSYVIKRGLGELKLLSNDSTIQKIDESIVNSIIEKSKVVKPKEKDPLKTYGADTVWFKNNIDSLWRDFKQESKNFEVFVDENDKLAISILSDFKLYKNDLKVIESIHSWKNRYVKMHIIKGGDTLSIVSKGSFVYLLPWSINDIETYDIEISELISKLLPNTYYSSHFYTSGKHFYFYLFKHLFYNYVDGATSFRKFKRRFPIKYWLLKMSSESMEGEYHSIGSIQWANDFFMTQKCVEVDLEDRKLPDNVIYSPLFGCRLYFMHPVSVYLMKKNKIRKRLEKDSVFQYISNNEKCQARIQFVNTKSFSRIAKKHFKEDLVNNNMDRNKFRGKLRGAIFFDNYEKTDKGYVFTRWLLLRDGTLILWENKGKKVLNLKSEYVPEVGFNCMVVEPEYLME